MELSDRRRYYFCSHCGTFEFIARDATEGIHVAEGGTASACPLCAAPLSKAVTDEGFAVDYCERCRGMLMDMRTFTDLVDSRRASAAGPGAPAQPLDERELRREITCPHCRMKMEVHPYYGPGNVVIDTCERCEAFWLDSGELTQIVDAPGRDRRP